MLSDGRMPYTRGDMPPRSVPRASDRARPTPPELVTVAAAAGFRTIGIRLTATPSVGVPPYLHARLADAARDARASRRTRACRCSTRIPALEPDSAGGDSGGFLEASARLGAKNVLVMSAEPDEARTLDRFCDLCDRAATYALTVCLEFAIYTGVRTLAHAAQVVAQSKRPNATILIDALHFSRSGGVPADVATGDPALLRYAQICDAAPNMPSPDDTPALIREARTGVPPGRGVLPLRALVAALPRAHRSPSRRRAVPPPISLRSSAPRARTARCPSS